MKLPIQISFAALALSFALTSRAQAQSCNGPGSIAYVPGQGTFGTLLFEDNYPNNGDADFNDQVVAYNYEITYDGAGNLVQLQATYNLLAAGANFHNSLNVRIPGLSWSQVSAISLLTNGASSTPTAPAGETELIVPLVSDTRSIFPDPTPEFINTDPSFITETPAPTLVLQITFNSGATLDSSAAPFDVYLSRPSPYTAGTQLEIHKPIYAGTDQADPNLIGQYDDGSTGGLFFINKAGLPFALDVPAQLQWMTEKIDIAEGYQGIIGFAGGSTNADWYVTPTDPGALFTGANDGTLPPVAQLAAPDLQIPSVYTESLITPSDYQGVSPSDGIAVSINDSGAIAGQLVFATDLVVIPLWEGGSLFSLSATYCNGGVIDGIGYSINNSGSVAGALDCQDINGSAALWTVDPSGNSIAHLLQLPGSAVAADAYGINDSSAVVGEVITPCGQGINCEATSLWTDPGQPPLLLQDPPVPTIAGATFSISFSGSREAAINAGDQISSTLQLDATATDGSSSGDANHAAFWADPAAPGIFLPEPCPDGSTAATGAQSEAALNAISDDGVIAGTLICAQGVTYPIVWTDQGTNVVFLPMPANTILYDIIGLSLSHNGNYIVGTGLNVVAGTAGPLLWTRTAPGIWELQPMPSSTLSIPVGVNDNGSIVGTQIDPTTDTEAPARWDSCLPDVHGRSR